MMISLVKKVLTMNKFNFYQFDHSCIPLKPIGRESRNAIASHNCVIPARAAAQSIPHFPFNL